MASLKVFAALRGLLIGLSVGLAVTVLGALAVTLSPVMALVWLLTPPKEAKAVASTVRPSLTFGKRAEILTKVDISAAATVRPALMGGSLVQA